MIEVAKEAIDNGLDVQTLVGPLAPRDIPQVHGCSMRFARSMCGLFLCGTKIIEDRMSIQSLEHNMFSDPDSRCITKQILEAHRRCLRMQRCRSWEPLTS